ncbi:flavin reductase family protein [soil metagenome]
MLSEVDDVAFRAVLGRFASGVTVLSTVHATEDGVSDHAITVSAFTSVSLDPPLVLVCVDTHNRFHAPVLAAGFWGVSVLRQPGHPVATWLSTRGRELGHQLDRVAHHRGQVSGVALVDGALAWLECRTWAAYDGADHTILVGEVVSAAVATGDDDPLLYYRSHYGALVRWPVSERGLDPAGPGSAPSSDSGDG